MPFHGVEIMINNTGIKYDKHCLSYARLIQFTSSANQLITEYDI